MMSDFKFKKFNPCQGVIKCWIDISVLYTIRILVHKYQIIICLCARFSKHQYQTREKRPFGLILSWLNSNFPHSKREKNTWKKLKQQNDEKLLQTLGPDSANISEFGAWVCVESVFRTWWPEKQIILRTVPTILWKCLWASQAHQASGWQEE